MSDHEQLYEVGECPPLGSVPARMHAAVIRPARYVGATGDPEPAFETEIVDTPAELGDDEVLVYVMAAGINFNNVWSARGAPVDVIAARNRGVERGVPWADSLDYHVGGSDASGIVWKVGPAVRNVGVGDSVTLHCAWYDPADPGIAAGRDPGFCDSYGIWGYETNHGSFAQFTRVRAHQCMPKAEALSWADAAGPTLVGATAERMLFGWPPNTVREGDPVLVWGGAGGLGTMAVQLVADAGGLPIAVVSSSERGEYCLSLGAKAWLNRRDYDHWGRLPDLDDDAAFGAWMQGVRKFGSDLWNAIGQKGRSPTIVFEHTGRDTYPTSSFVCAKGGMVVICAGTSGFNLDDDARTHWMHQKRKQGSHFANSVQANAFNEKVREGRIAPCVNRVESFDRIGSLHGLMARNEAPAGVMVALVGARDANDAARPYPG